MSKINLEDIDHLALLSRLNLSEEEKAKYTEQLSVVFEYFEILNEVNTDSVEETCQVTGLEDVFREDVVIDCNLEVKKKLIEQFPEKMGNLLKVKAVFKNK